MVRNRSKPRNSTSLVHGYAEGEGGNKPVQLQVVTTPRLIPLQRELYCIRRVCQVQGVATGAAAAW